MENYDPSEPKASQKFSTFSQIQTSSETRCLFPVSFDALKRDFQKYCFGHIQNENIGNPTSYS